MSQRNASRAREILETINYATIATVTETGEPWNSPVARTIDDDFNIYWISDKNGQHSRNVRNNGRVFIVIYNSTVPLGRGEGVFIRAAAVELNNPDEVEAAQILIKGPDSRSSEVFTGDGIRRIYKAVPEQVWMNDVLIEDNKFIKDMRTEIPLDALKRKESASD